MSLNSQIFPPQIETLFSFLANCSPLRSNLRSEEIVLLCSLSKGYHLIIAKIKGKFHMVGVLLGRCTVTTCVSFDSNTTTTKHAVVALTMAQQPHHDESVLAAFSANPC